MISVRTVIGGLHLPFPIFFSDLIRLLEPIHLLFELHAGTCSGSCDITMRSDGFVHYSGTVHDSGGLAAAYVAITSLDISAATGRPLLFPHKGHVGGTFSLDTRDSSWDQTITDAVIADNWVAITVAASTAKTEFGTGTGAIELLDGIVSAGSGIFVFGL
jgi:hypothetical protein